MSQLHLSIEQMALNINGKPLFSNVNFSLRSGSALHVLGPNGSGKTSLLRILCGLQKPSKGAVFWNGKNILEEHESYLKDLTYIGHKNACHPSLTVFENIQMMFAMKQQFHCDIQRILKDVGLESLGFIKTNQLSTGQRQRLTLIRLLSSDAKLWLLDEPLTGLDKSGVQFVTDCMLQHLRSGGMIVLTSHQSLSSNLPIEKFDLEACR